MLNFTAKIGVAAFFALALFTFSISQASADDMEVEWTDGDSIQATLDDAEDGDTINVYAALIGIDGMRKIPLMSLRQILPVNHSCVHYCELKALEICNILNHKGVTKQKCIDRSFDLCLSMIRYGDC